ncbi:MAG: hypothetical protein AAFU54_26335 [Chloroflexota bacterium]
MNRIRLLAFLCVMLLSGVMVYSQSSAQIPGSGGGNEACPAIVADALNELENSCTGIGRNAACYGNTDVLTEFKVEVESGFFSVPGDLAELAEIRNIETVPLDIESRIWGIALMNVQANLPGALPGQNVVLLLLGDTYVENDVPEESAFTSETTLPVTTARDVVLARNPDGTDEVLTIPEGTQLVADALTPNGAIRVAFEEDFGFIPEDAAAMPRMLSVLPTVTEDTQTPMQAFYFSTGIGNSDCVETPDSLIVQGPEELMVDIRANGADISIGSTIAMVTYEMLTPPQMEIIVLEDRATITCEDGTQIVIEEGFSSLATMSDLTDLGENTAVDNRIVNCDWTDPAPVPIARLLEIAGPAYNITDGVINYELDLPEVPQVAVIPSPTVPPRGGFVPQVPPVVASPTPIPPVSVPVVPSPTPIPPDDDDGGGGNQTNTGPDVSVSLIAANPNPNEGDDIGFTVSVTNLSTTDTATNVVVDLNLEGFPFTVTPPTIPNFTTGTNVWDVGTLAPGASDSFFLSVFPNAGSGGANYGVTANATVDTDIDLSNNGAGLAITVNPVAVDVAVDVQASDTNPDEGDPVDFQYTVTNTSFTDTASSVVATINLPSQPFTVSTTPIVGGGTYTTGSTTWNIGTIAPGASVDLIISTTADVGSGGAQYNLTISVTSANDPNAGNDTDTEIVDVIAVVNNTIFVDTTTDISTADGLCSLREAFDTANAGTIINDCTFTGTPSIVDLSVGGPYAINTGELPIVTSNFTLNTNGETIQAPGCITTLSRIIHVGFGGTLTINNGGLTGGCEFASGGTILNGGTLTLNNVNVDGEQNDTSGTGGAILSTSGTVNINGGTIMGMSAAEGGCVAITGGTASINGTVFDNCFDSLGTSSVVDSGAGSVTFTGVTINGTNAIPNCKALGIDGGGNTGGDGTCF